MLKHFREYVTEFSRTLDHVQILEITAKTQLESSKISTEFTECHFEIKNRGAKAHLSSIVHQEDLNPQRISDVHVRWDKIEESLLNMMQSFYEVIKDYRNKKIDIRFRRECESMIDELKGKFNGMSIEINKKKQLQHLEQAAKVSSQYWNPPIFFDDDDDDDEESSIPLRDIISELSLSVAITPDLPITDSLIMDDEHLDTIPETESDKENESSGKEIDHLDTIPDSVQSLLNHANSIIFLIQEFTGKLAPIDPIPPGIVEADLDEDIRLIEKLFNDESSPHSPEELNSEIPDAIIESYSPSPILVEDSDYLMKEIDIFLAPDDSIPPGIENDDYDSEGGVLFLEELLNDDSHSLPEYESFHVDFYNVPSSPRPSKIPLDDDVYFEIEPNTRLINMLIVEKERKARTILLLAIPKEHLRRFHGMDDAKEIWEAIRTRFGGNAKSKKMQKAVLKQQFKRNFFYQDQGAGKKEQKQNCLLRMGDGVVNWGEHTVEEKELNHALMAINSSNEVSLCSKTCIDSYNKLKTLCDEQMNQLGDQEAQILAYSQAVKKLEAQLVTFQKQQLSLNEKLKFQENEIYEKDEKLKKYRRIGMKAIKEKEQLQKTLDSWKDSSKNLWRLINSGMSSSSKLGLGYEIKSNNEVLSYEEKMNFSFFNCSKEDSVGKPLYNRFIKTNDFKGVPHPLSGDYTP
ncbi:hypothetical protein Tco_0472502 [Tanacetum coccineum]